MTREDLDAIAQRLHEEDLVGDHKYKDFLVGPMEGTPQFHEFYHEYLKESENGVVYNSNPWEELRIYAVRPDVIQRNESISYTFIEISKLGLEYKLLDR